MERMKGRKQEGRKEEVRREGRENGTDERKEGRKGEWKG